MIVTAGLLLGALVLMAVCAYVYLRARQHSQTPDWPRRATLNVCPDPGRRHFPTPVHR